MRIPPPRRSSSQPYREDVGELLVMSDGNDGAMVGVDEALDRDTSKVEGGHGGGAWGAGRGAKVLFETRSSRPSGEWPLRGIEGTLPEAVRGIAIQIPADTCTEGLGRSCQGPMASRAGRSLASIEAHIGRPTQ